MTEETQEERYIEIKCEDCGGEGAIMIARCYGGEHHECWEECEECGGSGVFEYLESDYIVMKLNGSA